MKLSFNSWAYNSFPSWLPSYTLDETIQRLASIGYDAIETVGLCGTGTTHSSIT